MDVQGGKKAMAPPSFGLRPDSPDQSVLASGLPGAPRRGLTR